MKLAPETSKHCNFAITGEKINGYYRFRKGFYGPANIPTIFQEKIDRTLGHETPVWLDDIIVVTRGTKEEHTKKLESVLTKLENEGYKASKKKSKCYLKKSLPGTPPDKRKNTKILFRGNPIFFAKFIPNLSEKTKNMRQLLKNGTEWEWTEERNTDFNNIKRELTSQPCLALHNRNKENIVTTDHRCLRYRTLSSTVAETKKRRTKINSLCKPIPKRREIFSQRIRTISGGLGFGTI